MRIIDNGLVPIYEGDDNNRMVNARDIHDFLKSGWDFSNWIQDRLAKYGFTEGVDFSRKTLKTPNGGRPRTEYLLTIDCAKEIAMVENNERGQQVRRYLIEVEKRYRQMAPQYKIPQTYAEALRLAADMAEENERQRQAIAIMEPKAEFHDAVAVAENCQEVGEVARVLGTGRNRLFRWMREQRILIPGTRLPYQEFIDAGYFRVIEQTWESNSGDTNIATKTMITGKGLLWLQKRFHKGAQGA